MSLLRRFLRAVFCRPFGHGWQSLAHLYEDEDGIIISTGRSCRLCGWTEARQSYQPKTDFGALRWVHHTELLEAKVVDCGGSLARIHLEDKP